MTHVHAFAILLVVLVLACSAESQKSPSSLRPEIPAVIAGVVFDSKSTTQLGLHMATALAIRNTLADEDDPRRGQPLLNLDISSAPGFHHTAAWLLGNHTKRIVSLLDPPQLINFFHVYSQLLTSTLSPLLRSTSVQQPLVVFLPRECVRVPEADSHLFTIKCLQPNEETIAVALMHRAVRVKVKILIPVSLSEKDRQEARSALRYFDVEAKNLELALAPLSFGRDGLLADIKFWNQHNKAARNESRSGSAAEMFGLLIMDREPDGLTLANDVLGAIAKDLDLGRTELIHVFTPWGVDALRRLEQTLKSQPFLSRSYSVVGAGTSQGGVRDPSRVAVLRQLSRFIGGGPSILTALSVYDATVSLIALRSEPSPRCSVLYGISPKPELASIGASLLQESDFILEDVIEMKNNRLSSFRPATSSFLSRQHLITLVSHATDGESDIHLCRSSNSRPRVRITTYDPFSQQLTRYTYATIDTLPQFIIIPNTHGYGLEIDCDHNEDLRMVASLRIACSPSDNNESVFCHHSNWIRRKKRAAAAGHFRPVRTRCDATRCDRKWHRFRSTRDAAAMEANTGIYQTFPARPATTATDMTIMKIQQPSLFSTQPQPQSQGSPLPELRQILKAAKPFVGGCVGSTMGCVMCVLVLGRLPLGPSPALCTGSCAVGVTGQCVALLGRVGAETTAICTELFRQGHIDIETFLADAEFGAQMRETAPLTLRGYQVLASPVVEAMRFSPTFTELVAAVAGPWAEHMKTLIGREGEESSSRRSHGWTLGAWLPKNKSQALGA